MKLWQHLQERLKGNQKVYLLTVIENIGSSPGRKGFKMIVAQDGFIFGSIGGGVMEFTLVEEAKQLLQESDLKIFLKRQVHRGHKDDGSGMICSGEQTVVFHPMSILDIKTVASILSCLQQDTKGQLLLTPTSISFIDKQLASNFESEITSTQDWSFKESIGFKNVLYIIGGGHVSVAVSDLFVKLGFHVVVFDDRENLNTLDQNKSAHQKMVVDFKDIANYISEGANHFVAIMTNRYIDDKLVLSKLIRSSFAYIGILGSRAKLKTMWKDLSKEGYSSTEMDQVHGPIGMSIMSQTPYEIAVSIAAEVIRIKNMNQ